MFFSKNGGGPGGPTQAQSACPHFLEKTSLLKRTFVYSLCFLKMGLPFFETSSIRFQCHTKIVKNIIIKNDTHSLRGNLILMQASSVVMPSKNVNLNLVVFCYIKSYQVLCETCYVKSLLLCKGCCYVKFCLLCKGEKMVLCKIGHSAHM